MTHSNLTLGDLITALMDFFLVRFGNEAAPEMTLVALDMINDRGFDACDPELTTHLTERLAS